MYLGNKLAITVFALLAKGEVFSAGFLFVFFSAGVFAAILKTAPLFNFVIKIKIFLELCI